MKQKEFGKELSTAIPTTDPQPLYGCQYGENCAPHVSYPADMLSVWNGKAVCESCFENDPLAACQDNLEDELHWSDLQPFVPAHERRIVLLESSLRDMCRGAGMSDGLIADLLRACAAEDDKAGEGGA